MTPPKVNPLPKEVGQRELFAKFQDNYDVILRYIEAPYTSMDCMGIVFEPVSYEDCSMGLVFLNGLTLHVNGAVGDYYRRDGADAKIRYDHTSDGVKVMVNFSTANEVGFREFKPEQNNDTCIFPVEAAKSNNLCSMFRLLEEISPDYLQDQLDKLQSAADWVRGQVRPYPPVHT